MIPTHIGNAHTIYGSFRRWRREGGWARVMDTLRQWERQSQGRLPAPSACCAGSQSIKTATQGTDVGFDGNKQIKGRKRQLLVDTLGLIVAVVVTAANADDRLGLVALVQQYCASGVQRLRTIVAGLKLCRQLLAQPALAQFVASEYLPGEAVRSDGELFEFARRRGGTVYHPTSTCKMGGDAMAVVDPELRVCGVTGLRVADASVMPTVVSGNTNAATIMIGEKCADLVRQEIRMAA